MKFGISMFPTHYGAPITDVAVEAERLGFDSIWVPEHSHIPLSTDFPFAPEVPQRYRSIFDPFVALSAAAAVTRDLKVGIGICLIPQRDPFNCAKEVATLDRISNGRFLLGVGAGWNAPEMENHGTPFEARFRVTRERIEAMKQIWTRDEAEYHGQEVDFEPVWMWPKPVQSPHPPIYLAGAGPNILKRVIASGDGWYPFVVDGFEESQRGRVTPVEEFPALMDELRQRAEQAAKPEPPVTVTALEPTPKNLDLLQKLGVERMMLHLPEGDLPAARAALERHVKAIERYQD